ERADSSRAEKLLRQAVDLYPDAFLPHFSLGAVYASTGDLDRAIEHLEDACQIDPVPQALYMLGNCFYEQGRSAEAVECLQEAVRLDPAFEEAHYLLGLAYLARHWNRKALAAFREAQRINPRRLRYQDLVQFLSGRSVERLPEVAPQVASLLVRAQNHVARGEGDKAM